MNDGTAILNRQLLQNRETVPYHLLKAHCITKGLSSKYNNNHLYINDMMQITDFTGT